MTLKRTKWFAQNRCPTSVSRNGTGNEDKRNISRPVLRVLSAQGRRLSHTVSWQRSRVHWRHPVWRPNYQIERHRRFSLIKVNAFPCGRPHTWQTACLLLDRPSIMNPFFYSLSFYYQNFVVSIFCVVHRYKKKTFYTFKSGTFLWVFGSLSKGHKTVNILSNIFSCCD